MTDAVVSFVSVCAIAIKYFFHSLSSNFLQLQRGNFAVLQTSTDHFFKER